MESENGMSAFRLVIFIIAFLIVFSSPLDGNDVGVRGARSLSINSSQLPSVMLGALFPIHVYSPNHSDCGRIQLEDGIQPLEALLFTLKQINNKGILPGFRLEVKLLLDSCDNVVHALEQSLQFIKGFICDASKENQLNCRDGTSSVRYTSGYNDRLVGVIGGQASQVSIQVANLLRIFHIPQISYLSTSTTLSNKVMFGNFYRTVPSDLNQVAAILEILHHFNWTYVSLVYSNTEYGNKGLEELERLAPKYKICFASLQRINVDRFKALNYVDVVVNLLKHYSKVKAVVIFSDKKVARGLMYAVKRQKAVGHFVWIGSDGWSGRHSVVEGFEEEIEGAIAVQPMWGNLKGFDEYFKNLRPVSNASDSPNPWFNEFWEEFFQCRLKGGADTPFNMRFDECTDTETIAQNSSYRQQTYLHFVRDAVYAFAYALRDMHRDLCGYNNPGLCKAMEEVLDGCRLKKYLDRVQFQDVNGNSFKFQENGDGPARYSILNYQNTSKGYIWKVVGSYLHDVNKSLLVIDDISMRFFAGKKEVPKSYCSDPCLPGQAMIQQKGDMCCWVCTNCSSYQILLNPAQCKDCPFGTAPDKELKKCVPFPVEFVEYSNHWAIAAITVAGFGLVITASIGFIFWVYSETPIVKAAGRELSFILLIGIFLSYGLTFVIVAKPCVFVCGTTRFFLGFCYTLCYSAIVTKTNRIARIFNSRHQRPRRTRYISPTSQVVITLLLTLTEVLINAVWLFLYPPAAIYIYPSRDESLYICAGSQDTSYLVGLVYPFVLIGFCTVYAFKTRKCPDGFNEARYIAFANYTTTILWLAFMPLFFTSSNNVKRTITLSFSLSLAATVLLVCLFMPKIYKVLFKPEKNTKEGVMNQHRSCAAALFSPTIQINGSFTESGLSKLSHPAASFTCLSNLASDSSLSKQTRSHSADAAVSTTSPDTSNSNLPQERYHIVES